MAASSSSMRRVGLLASHVVAAGQHDSSSSSGQCPVSAAHRDQFNTGRHCPVMASDKAWPVLISKMEPGATPLRVVVTGAAGAIAYSLIFMIANGDMFGSVPLELVLLDIAPMAKALEGVKMELVDGVYPVLRNIICSVDAREAFDHADVAILVGAFPRKDGMERKDLLAKNASIFQDQGKALDAVAQRHVKVLVVGNPANTNALTAAKCAFTLDRRNFTALTRLDHHRAIAQLSAKTGVSVAHLRNTIIWGNHSATQVPDARYAVANLPGASVSPVAPLVNDAEYLNTEFVKTVQTRGAAVIKTRGGSSAASAARAIVMHMKDWLLGTPSGEYVSMAVSSDKNCYQVPEGLIFSFPVTCAKGEWTVVPRLPIDGVTRDRLNATSEELLQEAKEVAGMLGV